MIIVFITFVLISNIPELFLDIGEDFLGIRYILSNSDLILATPVSLDISSFDSVSNTACCALSSSENNAAGLWHFFGSSVNLF